MKKISGTVATNRIGSTCKFTFEVDDDVSDEEIEQIAFETMLEKIDWNYEVANNTEVERG